MPDSDQHTAQRILQVALDLFTRQGYDGTSLREVADRLGVTTAALYYHFPSKDHMLISLVRPALERTDTLIEGRVPAADSCEARRELLASYLDLLLDLRELFRFLGRDLGALNRQGIGARMVAQEERLRVLLVGPRAKTRAQVRAAAALGALTRPVVHMPDTDLRRERDNLLSAAMAALQCGG